MKVRSAHWIYWCLLMLGGKLLSCQSPAPSPLPKTTDTGFTTDADFLKFTARFEQTDWANLTANQLAQLPANPLPIAEARKYLCTDQSRCQLADGSNWKEYLAKAQLPFQEQYTLLVYTVLEPPVDILTKLVCFDKTNGRQTSSITIKAEIPGDRHFIESKFSSESRVAVEHIFEVPRQADQVDDKLNRVTVTESFQLTADGYFELIDTQEKIEAIE